MHARDASVEGGSRRQQSFALTEPYRTLHLEYHFFSRSPIETRHDGPTKNTMDRFAGLVFGRFSSSEAVQGTIGKLFSRRVDWYRPCSDEVGASCDSFPADAQVRSQPVFDVLEPRFRWVRVFTTTWGAH